jgi:hypothetical protein
MRLATAGILAVFLATAAAGNAAAAEPAGAQVLKIEPPVLKRSVFAKPYQIAVITGSCPEGSEVVVKIVSPTRDFKLNKAAKSLGFVWVPSGHAEVADIPVMYAVLSSAKISSILPVAEQEKAGLCPDFRDVYQQARVKFQKDPPRQEIAGLRREYIAGLVRRFREGGLYQYEEGAVKIESCAFRIRVVYPSSAPLGKYRILCYLVDNGRARLVCEDTLLVKSSPVLDWLSYHAYASPGAYGIFSALVAVAVGLFVGVILGRGAGH